MSPQKKIVLFLLLTVSLSTLSYVPMIRAGTITTQNGLFVLTLMWSPGVAAMLTQLIATRSLRGLGWRFGSARWLAIAYILPIAYTLPVYAVMWLTGLGAFVNPYSVSSVVRQFASPNLATALPAFVLYQGTIGMVENVISGLGEEIGWRGLLVPELAKINSFTKTALISGIVWAAWHMPGIFLLDLNSSGTPALYAAAGFAVLLIGISFPFAWLTLKSGSLWPAVLLHASHNLFIYAIFDRLTRGGSITPYISGEFGVGLALTSLVVAYAFWRMQRIGAMGRQPAQARPLAQPG